MSPDRGGLGPSLRHRPVPSAATQGVLTSWFVLSALLAVLPSGVGGTARAIAGVVYVTLGTAVALSWLMVRSRLRGPAEVTWADTSAELTLDVAVVSIAASLSWLVLSSMALLWLGLWNVPMLILLLTLVNLAIVWVPLGAFEKRAANV